MVRKKTVRFSPPKPRSAKKVEWKVGSEVLRAQAKKCYPTHIPGITRDVPEMVVGALWVIIAQMVLYADNQELYQSDFPYLRKNTPFFGFADGHVKCGTIAIYTGRHMVTELYMGENIRCARHLFLIDGTQYIVQDLSAIKPL